MKPAEFLNQFSKPTQKVYRIALKHYFTTLNIPNPDQYTTMNREYRTDVLTFKQSLQTRPPKTMHTYMMAVKQYLEDNNIQTQELFKKQHRREKKLKVVRSLTQDYIPSFDELRNLLTHAKTKDRALILILLSSGMRIGELLQLSEKNVYLKEQPVRIFIPGEITKTGEDRTTFISNEASETLKEWVKIKKSYCETADARIQGERSNFAVMRRIKNDPRLFPMSYSTVINSWNRLLKKTGLDMVDERTRRYKLHPHVLRKMFRTILPAYLDVDKVEALMGHSGYLTENYVYLQTTDEGRKQLREAYLKGMGALSVFEIQPDLTEVNEQLANKEKRITELEHKLDDMNQTMIMLLAQRQQQQKP